jgi:hypothetical protein
VLVALVAVSTLAVTIGCGASSIGGGGGGQLLNGNYSDASLKGQYLFSLTGVGVNQALTGSDFFSETGVFTADGNGNLTILDDDFDQSGLPFALNGTATGTYHINQDGTGFLVFNYSVAVNYQITMIDDNHLYLTEQDTFATGSGSAEKQIAFGSIPSGTFAFKMHDLGASSRVGAISISSGNISGFEDLLTAGSVIQTQNPPTSISGSIETPPDANGRGQFNVDGVLLYYYVVNLGSSGKIHFLSRTGSLHIGQAEVQTGGPYSNATLAANTSYVFGSSGETSNVFGGIHSAGVFTSNGDTTLAAGTFDYTQDGSVFSNQMLNSNGAGTYSVDSDGRVILNLNPQSGLANQKVMWLVSPARAYLLTNNANTVEDGTLALQQGSSFSNNSLNDQAALFMDGFDVAFKDRSGAFLPNGSGSLKWSSLADSFDVNANGGLGGGALSPQLFTTGTYQVSSNGRVTATVNSLNNSSNSNVVFYLTSNNSGFMVQEDQGVNIGGAFAQQSGQ